MKIITLWQPYASLIPLGLKQNETRSWETDYRGPLLIHAAKRPFIRSDGINTTMLDSVAHHAWLDALRLGYEAGVIKDEDKLPFSWQLPLGCVVAIVDLVDCRKITYAYACDVDVNPYIHAKHQTELELAVGDWQAERFAWKLENIRSLDPITWKGAQGLRNAPQELIELVEQQLLVKQS